MTNRPASASGAVQTRWAIIGLCAALLFAGGVVWWTQRGDATPSSPSTSSPADGPSATPTSTVQPADGCLGGPDPEKAVLVAHDTAPVTGDGAAAFLATYFRWHYLVPKTAPVGPITEEVWAADLDGESKELPTVEEIQKDGMLSFGLTLRERHYRVEDFDGTQARVSMTFDVVDTTGVVSANAGMIALADAVNGKWVFAGEDRERLEEADGADRGLSFREELGRTGIPFQEAC